MKKSYLAILAALLVVGCTKDSDNAVAPGQDDDVRFAASVNDGNTRTSYVNDTDALKVNWRKDDLIGIYTSAGETSVSKNIAYKAAETGKSVAFEWYEYKISWADENTPHDFYAYYPYDERNADADISAIRIDIPAVQKAGASSLSHLSSLDFMYASAPGIKRTEDAVGLVFNHALSVIEVNLSTNRTVDVQQVIARFTDNDEKFSAEGATINLSTGEIDLSGAVTSNSITFDGNLLVVSGSSNSAFLVATPGHAGKTLEIVAVVNGTEHVVATKTLSADGIPVGKTAVVSGTLNIGEDEAKVVTDLSQTATANCYLVGEASKSYKFRADVIGNGVIPDNIQGEVSPTIAPTKARLLKTWVASGGYKNGTQDGSDPTMNKLIVKNSVSLQEENGVPYIFFETPDVEEFAAGNAVICATDDLDNIVWSWHLWVTPDYNLGDGDVTLNANSKCAGVVMMDRNLGALSNGSDEEYTPIENAQAAAGLYYQWGRKDPFMLVNVGVMYNTLGNYQNANGDILRIKQALQLETSAGSDDYEKQFSWLSADNAPTVADAVKVLASTPDVFYTRYGGGTDYYAPITEPNSSNVCNDLWGCQSNSEAAAYGHKTAYDPCPVGYRVPNSYAFAFFWRDGNVGYYGNLSSSTLATNKDYNAFNIDYDKTPIVEYYTTKTDGTLESQVRIDYSKLYGIYAYTGQCLDAGQSADERTDFTELFFPIFGEIDYFAGGIPSSYDAASGSLRLMSNKRYGNTPGVNLNFKSEGNAYLGCYGTYGCHSKGIPVRCVKE